ncbi:MAG: hypothetical protein LQ346_002819 [Caloplaca aetnensis]|nr:MAG: hypothetical protein LQ346_002819 [Caloplaca aetnensis]
MVSEFRAFVFNYAHHNPDRHDAIQSVLELLIQSKLTSSTSGSQQAPDLMLSNPQTHAPTNILDDSGPNHGADRQGRRPKGSIGQQRDTRGRPSSIIVPDTAMPLSSAGAGEDAQVERISKRKKVETIQRTSSTAIGRNSPTCSTDHASIDKSSKRPIGHQGKKRKLASDALPPSRAQEEVHTIPASNVLPVPGAQEEVHTVPASKANEISEYVQPHRSDDTVRDVSTIPSDLFNKLGLIASVEVLRDLKHTLFRLRSYSCQVSLVPNRRIDTLCTSASNNTLCTSASNNTLRSLQTAQILSMLRNELEGTEIGEQMCRFRKRLALSQFFDLYEFAQNNPLSFLHEDPKTMQTPSRHTSSKQAPRQNSRVLNRIVDLMFPYTAYRSEAMVPAGSKSRQMHEEVQRTAAVKKIQDWRRSGKHWSAIVKRFGQGILLLLPKSLPDEILRSMKKAMFEDLLTTMESILSQSAVLLRSATALSKSLLRNQAPAEILRLEIDDALLDPDTEYSRQDLDGFLEPCGAITPLEDRHNDTLQLGIFDSKRDFTRQAWYFLCLLAPQLPVTFPIPVWSYFCLSAESVE